MFKHAAARDEFKYVQCGSRSLSFPCDKRTTVVARKVTRAVRKLLIRSHIPRTEL